MDNCLMKVFAAIANNDIAQYETYLSSGIDIDIADKNGFTALHYAVLWDNVEATQFIILQKANINLRDKNGFTAFHLSLLTQNSKIICLLADNGADIEIKTLLNCKLN